MELVSIKNSLSVKQWMVIYTRPRWEKKVDELLGVMGIESFCPLRKEEHEWTDRKKVVYVPLFNSYVFVKVDAKEELKVRQTLGVINFIYLQGKPAIVRESVIEEIQRYLNICPDLEVINLKELSIGDRIQIKNGVFMNQMGQILKIQGKNVLMLLEHMGCVLVAKVGANNIVLT